MQSLNVFKNRATNFDFFGLLSDNLGSLFSLIYGESFVLELLVSFEFSTDAIGGENLSY